MLELDRMSHIPAVKQTFSQLSKSLLILPCQSPSGNENLTSDWPHLPGSCPRAPRRTGRTNLTEAVLASHSRGYLGLSL